MRVIQPVFKPARQRASQAASHIINKQTKEEANEGKRMTKDDNKNKLQISKCKFLYNHWRSSGN